MHRQLQDASECSHASFPPLLPCYIVCDSDAASNLDVGISTACVQVWAISSRSVALCTHHCDADPAHHHKDLSTLPSPSPSLPSGNHRSVLFV